MYIELTKSEKAKLENSIASLNGANPWDSESHQDTISELVEEVLETREIGPSDSVLRFVRASISAVEFDILTRPGRESK